MPMIKTRDGTNLYVKTWGKGRPVVLIHGWPLSADSWDDVSVAIADAGLQAIAYDRRGFGRSDQPWTGYDYDTLSDDLADVMSAVSASDATLIGFSMGGGEVARYMTRHAGTGLRQAALISAVVPYMLRTADNPQGTAQAQFDEMMMGLRADRAAFMSGFLDSFYGIGFLSKPVSDEVLNWSWLMAMQAGLHPTLACAKAFSQTDFRPDLANFKVPTLIVHGSGDKTVPIDASARAAVKGIGPHARLVVYEGAPHGLMVSHKDQLITELLTFLRS